ncbi:MAG: hypothetical protein K2X27_01585 [Candidatus Obscuribacterales bacterium]|nr:hypothetical protein [Candidatus Obscuribacterales bacterium]
MKSKRRVIAAVSFITCLLSYSAAQADEFGKLENIMNKVDQPQDWQSPEGQPAAVPTAAEPPPPATPTPQAFGALGNNYMRPGMPYSNESINALQHSAIWRYMGKPVNMAGAPAGQVGGNPFNLSPFGMLHYLWDDTTYTSSANPVTLYQTQNELQSAQQYSQMAQAAASRAKYARSPEERDQAAQQAQYYAGLAKKAALDAQQVSQAGSLNPADVAQAAVEQANQAQDYARQAGNYAQRGF